MATRRNHVYEIERLNQPSKHGLLVRIDPEHIPTQLIRSDDRRPLIAVLDYLRSKGLHSFLSGSAVESALAFEQDGTLKSPFNSKPARRIKGYSDIDILAAGNPQYIREVLHDLYAQGEDRAHSLPFDYNSVRFKATPNLISAYLNLEHENRFEIEVVRPARTRTRHIDLTLVLEDKLEKGILD